MPREDSPQNCRGTEVGKNSFLPASPLSASLCEPRFEDRHHNLVTKTLTISKPPHIIVSCQSQPSKIY